MKLAPNASTFGLPPSLWVPIAAATAEDLVEFVGDIEAETTGRDGRLNALCLRPHHRSLGRDPHVALWADPRADFFSSQLHPERQVWVHVDYGSYREAYLRFGMPPPPNGWFLDHVQNRVAIRLRDH